MASADSNRAGPDIDIAAKLAFVAEPSKQLVSTTPRHPSDQPLNASQRVGLICSAALVVLLFYLFVLACIGALLILIALEFIGIVVTARFGLIRFLLPFAERHVRLLVLIFGSFWQGRRSEFRLVLVESDAPALIDAMRRLAAAVGVPPPKEVRLEMNSGAWVRLRGFRYRSSTTLGLGYDLLAALSVAETEAVLAHELTHARLVRRGLKFWLNLGVANAVTLTNRLREVTTAYTQNSGDRFEIAQALLAPSDRLTGWAVRLVATYSRQDEFDADAGAAAICGSANLRSALLKLDQIATKTARIGWSERVALIQKGGYGGWLANELAVSVKDDVGYEPLNPYSTHPSTHDRIAALPPDHGSSQGQEPAIAFLANPDALAKRLVDEIYRVVALNEALDDRALRKWVRRAQKPRSMRARQWLILPLGLGGLCLIFLPVDPAYPWWWIPVGVIVFAAGVLIYRSAWHRDRNPLPIPSFDRFVRQLGNLEAVDKQEERDQELTAILDREMSSLRRAEKLAHLYASAKAALGGCDYLRAHIVARAAHRLDFDDEAEMTLVSSIAAVGTLQRSKAGALLNVVQSATNFRTFSTQWGAAWVLLLFGAWDQAEALLASALRKAPQEVRLKAYLAWAQFNRGKQHSALRNIRAAIAADADDLEQRILAVRLLIGLGQVDEAEQLLNQPRTDPVTDPKWGIEVVRIHLVRHDLEKADALIAELRSKSLPAEQHLALALACETARRDEQADAIFTSVLREGFFPVAKLGLARIAVHRGHLADARRLLLEALDTTRPLPAKAVAPLELIQVVLANLVALAPEPVKAKAWIARGTGREKGSPLASHSFLIFSQNQGQAENMLNEVLGAVLPSAPPNSALTFGWAEAPPGQQPVTPVKPGIQAVVSR